jgi:membrane protease YdiL (CAAX protease family)
MPSWVGRDRAFVYPGYCAVLAYDAGLDLTDATAGRFPSLARALAGIGPVPDTSRGEAIEALHDLRSHWADGGHAWERDVVRVWLGIALLEDGQPEEARRVLDEIPASSDASAVRELVGVAYPELGYPAVPLTADRPPPSSVLRWGWAARTLMRRLRAAGVDLAALRLPSDERTLARVPALASVLTELGVWCAIFVIGLGTVVVAARRGSTWFRIGDAVTVAPWSSADLWAVIVRGMSLGLILSLGLMAAWRRAGAGGSPPFASAAGLSVVVLLAWNDLLRPRGLRWSGTVGVPARRHTEWRMLALATVAVAAGALGEFGILALAHRAGVHVSWNEVMIEDLLIGPSWARTLVAIEMVVLAPLIEETIFRGLFYPTLRRTMPPLGAAFASAVAFAAVHGYGGVGTMTLVWGGVVMALLYEMTGTLLLPILVHGATNALVIVGHWRLLM